MESSPFQSIRAVLAKAKNRGVVLPALWRTDRLLQQFSRRVSRFRLKRSCRRKIGRMHSHHHLQRRCLDSDLMEKHRCLWRPLMPRVDPRWLQAYVEISGIRSPDFVPEDVYYTIVEPCLNYGPMLKASSDKNLYDLLYDAPFPAAILRRIEGVFYDRDYSPVVLDDASLARVLDGHKQMIIKPAIGSSGGRSVRLLVRTDRAGFVDSATGEKVGQAYLNDTLGRHYIVQQKIAQHDSLAEFNPSSVNTIRIFTYRSVLDEQVSALAAVLRVGQPGSIVDNQTAGGVSIGIDSEGRLGDFAIDKMGNKAHSVGDIDLAHSATIPRFGKMVELAERVAGEHLYARLLGFDLALDGELNVRIIEINNVNIGVNFHQMNTGPLFGVYTSEIIDYCVDRVDAGTTP